MEECSGYERQRLVVQPGLTCYWQIGGRANIGWKDWIEMDLDYIEDMSLWTDIKIIARTVPAVFDREGESCDIIIVDNASTDGTADFVRCQYNVPEVLYMNTGANLGGAGGFQYGVKKAVLMGYDYVWLMDDDTLPEKTALNRLLEVNRELNGKWGFLSSVAYWTDGSICRMNIQKKNIYKHIGEEEYNNRLI